MRFICILSVALSLVMAGNAQAGTVGRGVRGVGRAAAKVVRVVVRPLRHCRR